MKKRQAIKILKKYFIDSIPQDDFTVLFCDIKTAKFTKKYERRLSIRQHHRFVKIYQELIK